MIFIYNLYTGKKYMKDYTTQLYILPLENIQDFLRFTSMKWISQEPIYFLLSYS